MRTLLILSCLAICVLCAPKSFNYTTLTQVAAFTLDSAANRLTFNNAGDNSTNLLMPFPNTALSEILSCTVSYTGGSPFPIHGFYIIDSTKGPVFEEGLIISKNVSVIALPTVGPCLGNALKFYGQQVYSNLSFTNSSAPYTATCTISRQYQNATIPQEEQYWLNFFTGLNSYYNIDVPNRAPLGLKIEIRRMNASLPSPKNFFTVISMATNQKCLNPGIPDEHLPGTVDDYLPINDTMPGGPDVITHVYERILAAKSTIFVNVAPAHAGAPPLDQLFQGYAINMSLVILPSPVPPAPVPGNEGTVFGIICGVLVLFGAIGIGYYFISKRNNASREEYKPLHV